MNAEQVIPRREAAALRAAICAGAVSGATAAGGWSSGSGFSLVQGVLDAIPRPVYFRDLDGCFVACNRSFERFLGLPREQLLGCCSHDFWPEDLAHVYGAHDTELLSGCGTHEYESEFQSVDGVRHEVVFHTATLQDSDRSLAAVGGVIVDLTERDGAERRLRESEVRFRGLASQPLVGIVLIEDGRIRYSNARVDEIFGYDAQEVRELGPMPLTVESDRALVAENICRRRDGATDQIDFVFRGLRKDGAVVDIECHGGMMSVGGRRVAVSLMLDITERTCAEREAQAHQERLREQSTKDALTGLYNRRYVEEALRRELILAKRAAQPLSVIVGELDRFRAISDRFGELGGDEVLRSFGALLTRHARASDICGRYGGEEFLLVLPGMPAASAVQRAEQLRRELAATPIAQGRSQIDVTASFGIAVFPRAGWTALELIAAAGHALDAAKAAGRNRVMPGRAQSTISH